MTPLNTRIHLDGGVQLSGREGLRWIRQTRNFQTALLQQIETESSFLPAKRGPDRATTACEGVVKSHGKRRRKIIRAASHKRAPGRGIATTTPGDCRTRKQLSTTTNLVNGLSKMGIGRGRALGERPDQSEGVRNPRMRIGTHQIVWWRTKVRS